MMSPTLMRGCSEAYGSWNTIWIWRRSGCIWLRLSLAMSWPWNLISPEVGSSSRTMQRPRVDLPQPDSPTRPRVSPRAMSSEMPETACT